jgi:hypothetical protein
LFIEGCKFFLCKSRDLKFIDLCHIFSQSLSLPVQRVLSRFSFF